MMMPGTKNKTLAIMQMVFSIAMLVKHGMQVFSWHNAHKEYKNQERGYPLLCSCFQSVLADIVASNFVPIVNENKKECLRLKQKERVQ